MAFVIPTKYLVSVRSIGKKRITREDQGIFHRSSSISHQTVSIERKIAIVNELMRRNQKKLSFSHFTQETGAGPLTSCCESRR